MNDYNEQKIEITERNEKNKAWRKRIKIFNIGLFAPWIILLVLLMVFKNAELPIDGEVISSLIMNMFVATFVLWCVWIVFGIFFTRCPHCNGFLNRVPHNIKHCPHCTTILKVYPDFEDTDI